MKDEIFIPSFPRAVSCIEYLLDDPKLKVGDIIFSDLKEKEGREVELQKLQSCHRNKKQKSLDNISKQMDHMHYSVWHLLFH